MASPRPTRFIRPVKSSSLPTFVVSLSVAVATNRDRMRRTTFSFRLRRWSAVLRVRRSGRKERTVSGFGVDDESFWRWLSDNTPESSRPWVICPDAAAAFRLLGGWKRSDDGTIGWGNLVPRPADAAKGNRRKDTRPKCCMILSDATTILTHTFGPRRVTWVSAGNYLPCEIASFAASIGEFYPAELDTGPSGCSHQFDPDAAAGIVDRFFARVMRGYLDGGGGHWRATSAQLSHQTWRRSYYRVPVLEHDRADVARIERLGIYSGRAEAYFFGTVGDPPGSAPGEPAGPEPVSFAVESGPFHQVDVRSQYPAILRDCIFPVAFDRQEQSMSPQKLKSILECRCAVAVVEIQTPDADYPVRVGGIYRGGRRLVDQGQRNPEMRIPRRVIYPTGRFWTVLYGPELSHALARDRVTRVESVFTYRPGRPFAEYAAALIDQRDRARRSGDESLDILAKMLANSFAGKFASRPGGWRTEPKHRARHRWGTWSELNAETGEPESFRAIAGVSQKFVRKTDEPAGVPSIFGYLTSYGRVQIGEVIRTAGAGGVAWVHTDGAVLSGTGYNRILQAGLIGQGEAGRLRYLGTIGRIRVWSPTQYFCDGIWTLGGFSSGFQLLETGEIRDWRSHAVDQVIHSPESTDDEHSLRKSMLTRALHASSIGPFGWAIPVELRGTDRLSAWIED